jgi:glutathione synthase
MNHPIVFVLNRIAELDPAHTTHALICASLSAGYDVVVTDVLHMQVGAGQRVRVDGQFLPAAGDKNSPDLGALARKDARVSVHLQDAECVVVRTSPGRDPHKAWAHQLSLQALSLAQAGGVKVVNDPVGLSRASSKLYSARLPAEYTPATLVTRDPRATTNFIASLASAAVIKPLVGSGGRDIFFIDGPDADNLDEVCSLLGRIGYFVVQEYIPDIEDGDFRVLLLDGKVLELDKEQAVIHRVPKLGQFRSNVSLGARAKAGYLSREQVAVAQQVGDVILEDGIRFAGLDMVGISVLEVNVFSTGGLNDASRFFKRPFTEHVLTSLLSS